MKITVEVDDFWIEESHLESELKRHVTFAVLTEIKASIKKQVEDEITKVLTEETRLAVSALVQDKQDEFMKNGTLANGKKFTDCIKEIFEDKSSWNSPRNAVTQAADDFAKSLRARYDHVFANKIVVGLKEQGLLRSDVVELLLGEKGGN